MRYAILKKDWLLRGWTDEPRVLLNWKNGKCCKLSEQLFSVAIACDGKTDFDNIAGFFAKKPLLNKLIKEGIAEECGVGGEIEPYQQFRKADNPYLRNVHWSITGRCNLKCRHCYMESPAGRYGELPLADILRIIDQLVDANVHQVHLSGGEPFVRRDLLDIMAALAEKQIDVPRIFSNGLLITDKILRDIKKLGFSPSFQVSFDGCGTHDYMRGVTGTEEATTAAIRRIREHDFPVVISTCIDRINAASLPATYELLKELDIQYWGIAPPNEMGNWRQVGQAVPKLTLVEARAACAPIAKRWAADDRPFGLQILECINEEEIEDGYSPDSYDCRLTRVSCTLQPDGTLLPCPGYTDTVMYKQMPNLLREPFTKLWSKSVLRTIIDMKKSEIMTHNSECADCAEFKRCGCGCRATAVVATGNLLAVDPEVCKMYKNNKYQRLY